MYNKLNDIYCARKDMQQMGNLFEYCDKFILDYYNLQINKIEFLSMFMQSKCRESLDVYHSNLLWGAYQDIILKYVDVDLKGSLVSIPRGKKTSYIEGQMYWVGWMYAYIHFRLKIPTSLIVSKLPINVMLEQYITGHERGEDNYLDTIKDVFKGYEYKTI